VATAWKSLSVHLWVGLQHSLRSWYKVQTTKPAIQAVYDFSCKTMVVSCWTVNIAAKQTIIHSSGALKRILLCHSFLVQYSSCKDDWLFNYCHAVPVNDFTHLTLPALIALCYDNCVATWLTCYDCGPGRIGSTSLCTSWVESRIWRVGSGTDQWPVLNSCAC